MYCAYHGQILGNTKNLHDAHCIAEINAIDADIPTIDRQSQVGITALSLALAANAQDEA